MPEITAVHVSMLVAAVLIGIVLGWAARGNKSQHEKAAINTGWQEQRDAQRKEHERLIKQNKNLMDQVSQFQASNRDAKNRSRELSVAVQEAYARRDELQREIKAIRSNLEVAVTQRDKLQTDLAARDDTVDVLQEKDDKISQLSRELESWQDRLPPLIERFRARNEEAVRLEEELARAQERIQELEQGSDDGQTRIEPVRNPDTLTDGRDASNDPMDHSEDGSESAGQTSRDDLQQIKGIGPSIEKTLNEMGILRFEQIAEMSEYDIDRVARHLKGFHSRIYREDWIGQARDLYERDRSP